MSSVPKEILAATYEEYARQYARQLRAEDIMEAPAQATQREITLESLALVKPQRPDLHVYNELLVQYPIRGQVRPRQVVPDNMIVVSDEKPRAELSYTVPAEPAPPFWVMEYVSKSSERKDYEDNMQKYERELKVRYYLLFNPEAQEMTLYRHNGRKYVSVKPNKHGRHAVPELEIEVALIDGWVRFWYKGELLPLPADLQRELHAARRQVTEEKARANREQRRADQEKARADQEMARADQEKARADALEAELTRLRGKKE
jgi:Uma2 family endonuclease